MRTVQDIVRGRVAGFIVVILVVLIALLVRLWVLQVIDSDTYTALASANRTREATTIAPRGRILDRNGVELVTNRSTMVVLAPASLSQDTSLTAQLAAVLDMTSEEVSASVSSVRDAPLDLRVVAIDVPMDKIAYIAEHPDDFPGIEVDARAVRAYPQGSLAAHVLGYTGAISQNDLDSDSFEGYFASDIVGKTGAERSFESVLQGVRGTRTIEVNASGKVSQILEETEPVPGQDVMLTLDAEVQRVAEQALQDALTDARLKGFTKANAGAAVALDVTNGEVLAMASTPTYDPTEFIGGVSQSRWEELTAKESSYPLTNRAMMSVYPPASTYKAVTALAGLQSGLVNAGSTVRCTGRWKGLGASWGKWCWLHSGHGNEDLYGAFEDSCDTWFYELGVELDQDSDEYLQEMSRQFGMGSDTGIDLPGEAAGRVPDAEWKADWNEDYPEYQAWVTGDTVNMAIGQGDLLSSPLQVALAYAGIANDGVLMTPHVFRSVVDSAGKPVIEAEAKVLAEPKVSDSNISAVQTALRRVISQGTGASAFRGFDVPVAGKTGTAQMGTQDDYAWFVCYAPADSPKYAVAVLVEQGGSGGGVAAPAARQIMAKLFDLEVEHVNASDNSR